MSSLAAEPTAPFIGAFDDDAWEDLLNFVEEKRVIPIVGPELAVVQTDTGPENLYRCDDLYTRIRTIMREATFAPPSALMKLAEITDFDLYVNTTFDSLLEDALTAVRFGGMRTTDVAAYSS